MPLSLISLMRFPGLLVASKWNVYWLAPATAMGFTHCSGRDTIMCMSATLTLSQCCSPPHNRRLTYTCGVLSYQRMGRRLVTSSGNLPRDGQMWCLVQSAFKGKQKQTCSWQLWIQSSFLLNSMRNMLRKFLKYRKRWTSRSENVTCNLHLDNLMFWHLETLKDCSLTYFSQINSLHK